MTSSAASDTDRARKRVSGSSARQRGQHRRAAAVGQVDVEQDDVGAGAPDPGQTASATEPASPTTSTRGAELGADAGPEHGVVVDQVAP